MATQTVDRNDTQSSDIPTPEELVARATAMIPMLRKAGVEAEKLRSVPGYVIEAARDAGFFRILQPSLYGGYEYEPLVMYEVAMELCRGSTAVGWVIALLMVHNWEIGLCDPRIGDDIWGNDPDALISSSYAKFGTADVTEDGFVVNGRWPWSSGSDHCSWVVVGTNHPDPTSPIGFHQKVMILPRDSYEVDQDSWHMAGMQGTGSKDVVIKGAVVPEYRHHNVTKAFFEGREAGQDVFTAKTYKYPFGGVFGWTLAAVIIGAAQGAIDVYTEAMKQKIQVYTGQEAKRDPFNQQRVAEAAAAVYAAKATMRAIFAEMSAAVDANGIVSKDRRLFHKWNLAFHARAAADAVALMMKAAGGSAFALDHELQRFFRDTQTATNHAMLNADRGAATYGWFMFSGTIEDFVI